MGSALPHRGPDVAVVVRKDKPPDYNSVIMMKEMEDEELPTYIQAVVTGDRGPRQ